MPVIMPTHLATLAQCETPGQFKKRVWELLGDAISKFEPTGTDVMFVTYIEPEKTSGGIIKGQKTQQEVLFQGTVGLIVKLGPLADKHKSNGWEWLDGERKPAVNDWIVVRFADCWEMHLDGGSFRLIDPENIRGYIETPEIVGSRPVAVQPLPLDDVAHHFKFEPRKISVSSNGLATPSIISTGGSSTGVR